jgi:hypothetical protein
MTESMSYDREATCDGTKHRRGRPDVLGQHIAILRGLGRGPDNVVKESGVITPLPLKQWSVGRPIDLRAKARRDADGISTAGLGSVPMVAGNDWAIGADVIAEVAARSTARKHPGTTPE